MTVQLGGDVIDRIVLALLCVVVGAQAFIVDFEVGVARLAAAAEQLATEQRDVFEDIGDLDLPDLVGRYQSKF